VGKSTVNVKRIKANKMNKQPSLVFCVFMDLIGYATFALPGIGEFADILWAPVSAFIFFKTFGGWKGAFGGLFNFAEEILPGTDFLPTFTITWLWQYFASKNKREPIKAG
jgi:hypothetical protein